MAEVQEQAASAPPKLTAAERLAKMREKAAAAQPAAASAASQSSFSGTAVHPSAAEPRSFVKPAKILPTQERLMYNDAGSGDPAPAPTREPAATEEALKKPTKAIRQPRKPATAPEALEKPVKPTRQPIPATQIAAATAGNVRNGTVDPDAMFQAIYARATEADAGRKIVTSYEAEAMICGLPLPALAPRFLFQQDVIPLGRQIMIFGDFGSAKSALLAEMERWFLINYGLVTHIDNENKDGPDLRNAIFYRDPRHSRRVAVESSDTQQDWMRAILKWKKAYDSIYAKTKEARAGVKQKPGETAAEYRERTATKVIAGKPGYIHPWLIGLDSITGTSSETTIQGIEDDGSPKNRFQEEAKFLSDFAKALPKFFRKRPACLVTINHRKDQVDSRTGFVKDRIPGGSAMRYMDTTEIKTEKIGKIESLDYGGIRLALSNPKNSLGPTGGRLEVDFKWWYVEDPETGRVVQQAAWDWDAASIELLIQQGAKYAKRAKAIEEVVDLHVAAGKKVWSKDLGIPSTRPVTFHEAGKLLEQDSQRIQALQDLLRIKSRTQFIPGIEYGLYQEHLLAAARRQGSIYGEQANSDGILADTGFIDEELDALQARTTKKSAPVVEEEEEYDEAELLVV